jgi:hypothetical protein
MQPLPFIVKQKWECFSLIDDYKIEVKTSNIYRISFIFSYSPERKKVFQCIYDDELIENIDLNNCGKEDRIVDNILYEYSFISNFETGKRFYFYVGEDNNQRSSTLCERKSGFPPPYNAPNENRLKHFAIIIENLLNLNS